MKKDRNRSIEYAKDYCRGCIEFDTPRLAKETFPDGVAVEDVCEEYEVYVPGGMKKEDEAFILVHGGAFVYGSRRLDKRFGMFLALRSSMRVFNVDYRLIPEVGIIDQLSDIMAAAGKISRKYDIRKFHLVGDSAGGYLSFATALLMHSREMRDELGIKMDDGISVLSASPICGCYRLNDVEFPGSLFEEGEETKLPDYIYDLTKARGDGRS